MHLYPWCLGIFFSYYLPNNDDLFQHCCCHGLQRSSYKKGKSPRKVENCLHRISPFTVLVKIVTGSFPSYKRLEVIHVEPSFLVKKIFLMTFYILLSQRNKIITQRLLEKRFLIKSQLLKLKCATNWVQHHPKIASSSWDFASERAKPCPALTPLPPVMGGGGG